MSIFHVSNIMKTLLHTNTKMLFLFFTLKLINMPWYVVVTRPRAELKVKDRLKAIGVSVCCPVRVEKRQWSDRVKKDTAQHPAQKR